MFEKIIPIALVLMFMNAGFMVMGVIPINSGIFGTDLPAPLNYSSQQEMIDDEYISADELNFRQTVDANVSSDIIGGTITALASAMGLVTEALKWIGVFINVVYNLLFGFIAVGIAMDLPPMIIFFYGAPLFVLMVIFVITTFLEIANAIRGGSV